MDRSTLVYALLFSLPVGLGVSVAVLRTVKRFDVAGAAGLVAATILFAFVVLITSTGSAAVEPDT